MLVFLFYASKTLKSDAARYRASRRLTLLGTAHGKAKFPAEMNHGLVPQAIEIT